MLPRVSTSRKPATAATERKKRKTRPKRTPADRERGQARAISSNDLQPAGELTEFGVKHRARHLVTSPREIAKHTGLDVKTVKKYLSRIAKKRVDGKVVVIRVGNTDVMVRLTNPQAKRTRPNV